MKRIAVMVVAALMAVGALVGCSSSSGGFEGVNVSNGTNLTIAPEVTSKSSQTPTALEIKDLVVGTGAPASPTATVQVQYVGLLYANGVKFDSSWERGAGGASFPLTGVVPGFTQGIGGTNGVAPMKVGGRRIMILPSALAYKETGRPPVIPANAPLVFVVDLLKVS